MFRRALPWVGWTLVVGLALVSLWGWYIYAQRVQLDRQNRRELAHAARNLGNILSGLSSQAGWFFDEIRFPQEKVWDALREFTGRNPHIRSGARDRISTLVPCREENTGEPALAGLANPRKLVLVPEFAVPNENPKAKARVETFELTVNTEAIFDDVVISGAFEYLFIANREGELLFEMAHGASAERRSELGELELRAQQELERKHLTIRLRDVGALETPDGNSLDSETLVRAGGSRSVRLGEEEYQLYSYPFMITDFRVQEGAGGGLSREPGENAEEQGCSVGSATWIVGGLVDPERMFQEAITFSPQWTFLLFVLLLVAVVGQPFVKLFVLSPTERFHFSDTCLLLPSATFLLLLATILILDASTYWRLQSLASGSLEALANRLEDDFTAEIRQMRDQLVTYDKSLKELASSAAGGPCQAPESEDVRNLLAEPKGSLLAPPQEYRYFSQVAWVDSSGKQFFKGTVYRENTPRVGVSHRPYFTEPRDRHLWSFSKDGDDVRKPFFVQSFRSFTTGHLSTSVSIRSELQCSERGAPVVAVMSGEPLSVRWPRLPVGYGFAIITADGLVLYHSEQRRVLKEQFYEEVTDPERLHAAVRAGTPQHFGTTYSRWPTEIFIRPFDAIDGARWFVVTFRNKQWLSTANTEVLLGAILWALVPFGLSLLLCLVLLSVGKGCLELIAPDERKTGLYVALVFTYATALLVGLGGTVLGGDWLFTWSLWFPLLVAGATLVVYLWWKRNRAGHATQNGSSHTAWYVAAVAGLWVSTAIVPGAGLFKHSWRMEMKKLVHIEDKRRDQHKRDWTTRDEELTKDIQIAGLEGFLSGRQRYWNAYQVALADPQDDRRWDRSLDKYLPLYNRVVEQLRYQGPGQGRKPIDGIRESYGSAGVVVDWRALLGGVIISLVAWWWLRYKVRYLFWSHLAKRQNPAHPAGLVAQHAFVILLTPSEREKGMVSASLSRRARTSGETTAGAEVEAVSGTGSFVSRENLLVVDNLESAFSEPHSRHELLERLGNAVVKEGGRAVIVSPVDPFQLLSDATTNDPDSNNPAVSASEKGRWLQVLEPFVVHVTRVGQAVSADSGSPDQPSAFAEMRIREGYFRSLWRYCSQRERLTLIQVAEEGFANPQQAGSLKRLVEKGLVVLRPNVKLMDPAFEVFVRSIASSPEVKTWEQPEGRLGWRGSRWIFALLLVAALVVLGGTQESWIRGATGMLTVLAGGLEAVWRLLRAAQRDSDSA